MAAAENLDAVALLKADHRKVEDLFAKFEAATGDGSKKALAEQKKAPTARAHNSAQDYAGQEEAIRSSHQEQRF